MVNPQVNTISNFPGECWRHRFNMDIVKEDWEEFKDVETKKWQVKIFKYFGEDPKIQQKDLKEKESSATKIGSDPESLSNGILQLTGILANIL